MRFRDKTPYQAYGDETQGGWKALIDPLIEMCARKGNEIAQIKEKFGGLRFYVGGYVDDELNAAILQAEAASFKMCEVCGAEGSVRGGGWLKTLCDEHANGRATLSPGLDCG